MRFLAMTAVAFSAIVAALLYGRMITDAGPETVPHLSGSDTLVFMVSLLLSLCLIRALCADGRKFGQPAVPRLSRRALGIDVLVLLAAIGFGLVFVRDPALFSRLSLEDGPVEWLSALFLFAAAVFFAAIALGQVTKRRQAGDWEGRAAIALAAFFSVACFVIGMEEISWMQRVFDVETPGALSAVNDQNEFNLHNISTGASELVYYSGAFVLLILIPFAFLFGEKRFGHHRLAAFAPSIFVLAAAAPLAAFNCGRWGMMPTQMATMMTVLILLLLSDMALRDGLWREFLLFAGLAVTIVSLQEVFLVEAERLARLWDPTEYKELFIAAGLALYAGETWWRLRGPALQPAVA